MFELWVGPPSPHFRLFSSVKTVKKRGGRAHSKFKQKVGKRSRVQIIRVNQINCWFQSHQISISFQVLLDEKVQIWLFKGISYEDKMELRDWLEEKGNIVEERAGSSSDEDYNEDWVPKRQTQTPENSCDAQVLLMPYLKMYLIKIAFQKNSCSFNHNNLIKKPDVIFAKHFWPFTRPGAASPVAKLSFTRPTSIGTVWAGCCEVSQAGVRIYRGRSGQRVSKFVAFPYFFLFRRTSQESGSTFIWKWKKQKQSCHDKQRLD